MRCNKCDTCSLEAELAQFVSVRDSMWDVIRDFVAKIEDLSEEKSALLSQVTELESELAALKEANAWHPASEPPIEDDYVEIRGHAGYWHSTHPLNNPWGHIEITHWRELPEPPETDV